MRLHLYPRCTQCTVHAGCAAACGRQHSWTASAQACRQDGRLAHPGRTAASQGGERLKPSETAVARAVAESLDCGGGSMLCMTASFLAAAATSGRLGVAAVGACAAAHGAAAKLAGPHGHCKLRGCELRRRRAAKERICRLHAANRHVHAPVDVVGMMPWLCTGALQGMRRQACAPARWRLRRACSSCSRARFWFCVKFLMMKSLTSALLMCTCSCATNSGACRG